jgi:hypothetical protein
VAMFEVSSTERSNVWSPSSVASKAHGKPVGVESFPDRQDGCSI